MKRLWAITIVTAALVGFGAPLPSDVAANRAAQSGKTAGEKKSGSEAAAERKRNNENLRNWVKAINERFKKEAASESFTLKPDFFGTSDPKSKKPTTEPSSDSSKPSEQVVLQVVGSKVDPRNPLADSYIKLQFLSAIDGRFSEEGSAAALTALVNAAPMTPIFGVSDADKRVMDAQKARFRTEEEITQFNEKLTEAIAKSRTQNEVHVAYRRELVMRLDIPDKRKVEQYQAMLEDLWQRAEAGMEVNADLKNLEADILGYSALADKPDVQRLVKVVEEYLNRKPKTYYLSAEIKDKRFEKWKTATAGIESDKLKKIVESLRGALK
jgi:hypothetical protein